MRTAVRTDRFETGGDNVGYRVPLAICETEKFPMPIECITCKAMNPDTASFCNNCGTRLSIGPGVAPAEHEIPKPQTLPEAVPHPGLAKRKPRTLPEDTQSSPSEWADPRGSGWSPSDSARQQPPATSSERAVAVVKDLAKRAVQSKKIEGEVRRFDVRPEMDNRNRQWTIWSFLLESFDEVGNRQTPVQVEMRALRFDGWINEGDKVEIITSKWQGGRLQVSELRNKTTRSTVRAKGSTMWPPPMWVWNLIWIIGIVLVIAWILSK